MIDNKWFCEPDDQRESWCFLFLKVSKHNIIESWEIGYGNPTTLVRTLVNHKSKEKEIIKELLRELYYCRKKDVILITYSLDVLPILRTRIILLNIEDASLYRIKHVSVERLLSDYFLPEIMNSSLSDLVKRMGIEVKNPCQVDLLRHLLIQIGTLLPYGVI